MFKKVRNFIATFQTVCFMDSKGGVTAEVAIVTNVMGDKKPVVKNVTCLKFKISSRIFGYKM